MGFVEPQFHFLIKKNNSTQTEKNTEHQGPHLLTMSTTIPTQTVGFMISYFINVCYWMYEQLWPCVPTSSSFGTENLQIENNARIAACQLHIHSSSVFFCSLINYVCYQMCSIIGTHLWQVQQFQVADLVLLVDLVNRALRRERPRWSHFLSTCRCLIEIWYLCHDLGPFLQRVTNHCISKYCPPWGS